MSDPANAATLRDTVVFRDAVADDCAAVADIYAHYVADGAVTFDLVPLTDEQWRGKLAAITADGWPFIVAADAAGRVIGFAYVSEFRSKPAYRWAVEDTIYLHPDTTGRGIGPRLFAELLTRAEAAGARRIVAVIADVPETAGSIALHTRFGFADAGRWRSIGFKHGRWLDTVTLILPLGGDAPPVED